MSWSTVWCRALAGQLPEFFPLRYWICAVKKSFLSQEVVTCFTRAQWDEVRAMLQAVNTAEIILKSKKCRLGCPGVDLSAQEHKGAVPLSSLLPNPGAAAGLSQTHTPQRGAWPLLWRAFNLMVTKLYFQGPKM